MRPPMKVPKYMVDKDTGEWRIWNTVDHEYTSDGPFESRGAAEARAKELNG